VTTASSSTVPSGNVISENPVAATLVNIGSAVDLVVSSGPAQYLLTTAANPSNGGSVTPSSGNYPVNTVVNLQATANPGYVFSSWTGNVANANSASTTVTMSGPQSVTANFTPTTTRAPAFVSALGTTFALGVLNTFSVVSTGNPTPSITWTGTLPKGVNLLDNHDGTLTLTGTPTAGATAHLTFKAANGVNPVAVQHFTLMVSGPLASLAPASVPFNDGYINKPKSAVVTIRNAGNATLNIGELSLIPGDGTNAGDFTLQSSCEGAQILPSKTCKVTVVSNAIDVGQLSATLSVADNAPGSPHQIGISANVINPKASFSPGSLIFGKVSVGDSETLSTTITSTGTTALLINSVVIAGVATADYTLDNPCPGSLDPGNMCTISVTFTPSTAGSRAANLIVSDNVGSVNAKKPLALSGKGQ
jgi:uncharacterized repeat protein (TIGR02543 family)